MHTNHLGTASFFLKLVSQYETMPRSSREVNDDDELWVLGWVVVG